MTTRIKIGTFKTNPKIGTFKTNQKYDFLASAIPTVPKAIEPALRHDGWRKAIFEEMKALEINYT